MDIPEENIVNDFTGNHARSFFSNRVFILIAAILFVLIVALVAMNYLPAPGGNQQVGYVTTEFSGIVLPQKPTLSGAIVNASEFDFGDYGWIKYEDGSVDTRDMDTFQRVLGVGTKWHGNGWAANSTYGGTKTLVVIHPFNTTESRYIEQTVTLPPGKTYYLVFGLANIAGYFGPTGCDDNVFNVSVSDASTGVSDVLFNNVLNAKDGWKHYMVGISKFAGKTVTIRIDGIAGGPCGKWAAEWGAVDYVDVLSSEI